MGNRALCGMLNKRILQVQYKDRVTKMSLNTLVHVHSARRSMIQPSQRLEPIQAYSFIYWSIVTRTVHIKTLPKVSQ